MAPRPIADAAMKLTQVTMGGGPKPPPPAESHTLERITLDDLDEDERRQVARDGEWVPPLR